MKTCLNCHFLRLSCINVQDIKCSLINPIKEGCLSSDEHEAVDKAFHLFKHERTSLLHKYSIAIHLNGELYGSLALYWYMHGIVCDALPGLVYYFSVYVLLSSLQQNTKKWYI